MGESYVFLVEIRSQAVCSKNKTMKNEICEELKGKKKLISKIEIKENSFFYEKRKLQLLWNCPHCLI